MGLSMRHLCTVGVASSLLSILGIGACGGRVDEATAAATEAVTSFTISGTVLDSSGNPIQPPVTIALNGTAQKETLSNPATGAYSFTVGAGSYSLSASTTCLSFSPSVDNINNIQANTTVNFVGSGTDQLANCEPATSAGGTSGSLTIHGTVTSAGHPVAGAKITVNGSTQGFRISDETGAYSFSVNHGSYTVSASGACNSYSPSIDNLNNITTSQTANFSGSGNCPPAPLTFCPTLDTDFDLSAFGDVCSPAITTNSCIDRLFVWDSSILFSFPAIIGTDCRFGQFNNLFSLDAINEYLEQLEFFIVYIAGCPYVGTQAGPLTDALVPQPLVAQGFKFTTADVQALSDDFVAGFQAALTANGTPLTNAQVTALQAQLTYLQGNVPNVVSSSSLSYSTCPADGGTQ